MPRHSDLCSRLVVRLEVEADRELSTLDTGTALLQEVLSYFRSLPKGHAADQAQENK